MREKGKSGFIPGKRRIPRLVRVYSTIIMAMSIVSVIVAVIVAVILGADSPIGVLLQVPVAFVFYRLGRGLGNGERQAVYGISILGVLALLLAIGIMIAGSLVGGLVLLGFTVVFYAPPLLVAFRRWDLFR